MSTREEPMNKRDAFILIRAIALLAASTGPAHADVFLAFQPTTSVGTGVSPEGCWLEPAPAIGHLGGPGPYAGQHDCHSAAVGYTDWAWVAGQEVGAPSTFISAPFANGLELTGFASLHVHYVIDTVAGVGYPGRLAYRLYDVPPIGLAANIAMGTAIERLRDDASNYAGQTGAFNFDRYTLAPGHSLKLVLVVPDYPVPAPGRLLFGGHTVSKEIPALGAVVADHNFEDAGLFLATAAAEPASQPVISGGSTTGGDAGDDAESAKAFQASGGALSFTFAWPLFAAALLRRRPA